MVGATIPYYSKDMATKDTSQQSADSSCVKWASEQEFSKYLGTVACPAHTVYRVVDNIVSGQSPSIVVKLPDNSIYNYVVPVGISRQPGILRNCRLLSVTDIIEYFGRNEITREELYKDLLGGKHYKEFSTWRLNAGGTLYDAIRYWRKPGPNDELYGLSLNYLDGSTVFKEGPG